MYKFEISADTPQELEERMMEFAVNLAGHGPQADTPSIPAPPTPLAPVTFTNENLPTFPATPENFTAQVETPVDNERLDSAGLPWDERIHASTKSFNKDGTWRTRRGLDPAVVTQVQSELKSAAPQYPVDLITATPPNLTPLHTLGLATSPIAPPPPAPTVDVVMPSFQPPVQQAAAPSYSNVAIPQDVRPVHSLRTFQANLMQVLAQLIEQNKINQKYIEDLKTYFGVKEIWNVIGSERQIMELFKMFCDFGFITGVEGQ